jgi:PAS domain S-box-containing protein
MAPAIKNFTIAMMIGITGLILLTIIIWFISRNITRPLIITTSLLKDLARGAIHKTSILDVQSKDEIGEMTASANTLVRFLQTTAEFARKIGEGDLNAHYTLLSEEDVIGQSLVEMRDKLRESKEKIELQSKKLIKSNQELEKLSVVARETDNAVIIMDAKGNIEWVNEGLVRLYGYSFEEFRIYRGNNILDISSNPVIDDLLEECIKTKKSVHYISENFTKSGKLMWAQTTMTPVLDEKGNIVKLVTIDSDITKIKEAEAQISQHLREIEEHRDELQELIATKDRFFAIIAHDLKNPFTALYSIIQTLSVSFGDLEKDEQQFYVDRIEKITAHLVNLLDNLLLWARAQTEKLKINPEKINIRELITENIHLVKAAADKKLIAIKEDIPDDLIAISDKNMLNTVIRNLLSNAIKYTNREGLIKITGRKIKDDKGKKLVKVDVSDNGIGITGENMGKLFRIDKNPSTSGTADEKGTGLGLIICKDFIEKNGGKISVESYPEKGSTFHFTLPAARFSRKK